MEIIPSKDRRKHYITGNIRPSTSFLLLIRQCDSSKQVHIKTIYISLTINYTMEVYEIVAIFIGIVICSFSLIALTSIFYCIYISCRGCIKPTPAPALDGTFITDKSTCNSNQFPKAVIEKCIRNTGISSAPSYV